MQSTLSLKITPISNITEIPEHDVLLVAFEIIGKPDWALQWNQASRNGNTLDVADFNGAYQWKTGDGIRIGENPGEIFETRPVAYLQYPRVMAADLASGSPSSTAH